MSPFAALGVFLTVFLGSAILFRVPVGFAIGLGTAITLLANDLPIMGLAQVSFSALDSFPLLAVPFFIFGGMLMQYSGITRSLINLVVAFIGRFRGHLGAATVLGSMAFSLLTGSAIATITAVGNAMIPEMVSKGYSKSYASAITAASSFLGILIPPSVPGIIFALSAGVSVSEIWLSTLGVGLIIAALYIVVNYFIRVKIEPKTTESFVFSVYAKNIAFNFKDSIAALMMPFIIFGGIYGGFVTPTEAGAVAALYGLIYLVIKIVFKIGHIEKSLYEIAVISGISTATISILIVFANAAGRAIALIGVSDAVASFVIANFQSPIMFLLVVNIVFLILGMFIDINAAIMILTPLLMPAVHSIGIDPIHFGAVVLVNLCLGFITPPLSLAVFVACKISGAHYGDVMVKVVPFFLAGLVGLIIVTYVPSVALFFPNLLRG